MPHEKVVERDGLRAGERFGPEFGDHLVLETEVEVANVGRVDIPVRAVPNIETRHQDRHVGYCGVDVWPRRTQ